MSFVKLTDGGIDIDALMARLMGNASLIRTFIKRFIEDKSYAELISAFADGDMERAETASHTLKGMCGNLSLTSLFGHFTDQVNYLRSGERARAEACMARIAPEYEKAASCMREWLAER